MSFRDAEGRRLEHARKRQLRVRRERFAALGSLISVAAVVVTVVLASTLGSGSRSPKQRLAASAKHSTAATSGSAATHPGTAMVPILTYHVINAPPAQTSAPAALYVPADEFSSQMDALKSDGWHAVTLDQLEAYWTRGVPLGPGKPIVISFDTGYGSQYSNAVPVLKRLGWVGVENLQLNGLSAAEGGLTDSQVRGLIAAGWELDSQGIGDTDLISLDPAQADQRVATAREMLRSLYGVSANWFSYPSGDYDPTVIAAVRAAGFVGSTTAIPGWASSQQDRFVLPRLTVRGGTTPPELLAQIASATSSSPVPPSDAGGTGIR
ncbi:MAG: polysaccharide deacetylase family protein [Solirubrobacteraceae bacterium]